MFLQKTDYHGFFCASILNFIETLKNKILRVMLLQNTFLYLNN